MIANAPGWDANGLFTALGTAGLLEQRPSAGMPRLADGLRWIDIEPSGIASTIELDPAAFVDHRPAGERELKPDPETETEPDADADATEPLPFRPRRWRLGVPRRRHRTG